MARTVRTKVYKFNELKPKAKEKAIEQYRSTGMIAEDIQIRYDEAHETVKAFHNVFGTEEGTRSWLDVRTEHIDDNTLSLKGLRLQKYIWNNYSRDLYKGKYYSLWSKKDVSYKHHKEGHPVLKTRYSKVMLDNNCVLTGTAYDHSLLQPMYDFLENYRLKADYYSYMDLETLLNDCFASLDKTMKEEEDYFNSDESIIESIQSNEYEFTQDGKIF
jgi:hypothetical protein